MKTVQTTLYHFEELSEEAKEKAVKLLIEENMNLKFWQGEEILESIEKGLEALYVDLKNYSIDFTGYGRSTIHLSYDKWLDLNETRIAGVRLFKLLNNQTSIADKLTGNCELTGVCYDEDFLDPIREFMERPTDTTFNELVLECINSAIDAGRKEYEYMNSREYAIEQATEHGIDFTESGAIYKYQY